MERRRTVPLWGPLTLVVVVALGSLLVMQVQTLPDPLPESAFGALPERGQPVDPELADAGEELFRIHCAACHREGGSATAAVGPSLVGVTQRRSYPWIRGMVLEPDSMHRADSIARRLLLQWRVPMRDVGLSEPGFRAVLEYLRLRDRPPGAEQGPRRFGPAPAARDTGAFALPMPDTAAGAPVGETGRPAAPSIDTVGGSRPDPEATETPRPPADTLEAPGGSRSRGAREEEV